jgi:hypothetical protein
MNHTLYEAFVNIGLDAQARRAAYPHLNERQHVALDNTGLMFGAARDLVRRYIPGNTRQTDYRAMMMQLAIECQNTWKRGEEWRGHSVPEL